MAMRCLCPGRCISLWATLQTQTKLEVKDCSISFSNSETVLPGKFGDGLSSGSNRVLHQKPHILQRTEPPLLLSISISLFVSLLFFSVLVSVSLKTN